MARTRPPEQAALLPETFGRNPIENRPCSIRDFLRLAKKRQVEGHLSVLQQLSELSILLPVYGVGPGYYQMAGFWDRKLRWTDKTAHVSAAAYRKIVDRLNPRPYQKLSQNKLAEKALLRLFDVPSSELLGFYHALSGWSVDDAPLRNPAELSSFLAGHLPGAKICFKAVEGWVGAAFRSWKWCNAAAPHDSGASASNR